MRPDLSHMLDEALERLRAGTSIEECLSAYPDHAAELEPMLRTAAAIQRQASASLPPSLEQWLASGRREIEDLAHQTYTRPDTLLDRVGRVFNAFFGGMLRRGAPRLAGSLLSALVICLLTFYTVDAAAAGSLPGDYLYDWKLFSEQARIALAVNPNQRAQLVAVSVERRVAEIGTLAEREDSDPERLAATIAHLNEQVHQALDTLPATSPEVRDRTVARIGRLLVRAEGDLREAAPPDTPAATIIESAVAEVAELREELPVETPEEAAAVVPAPPTPTLSPVPVSPTAVAGVPSSPAAGGIASPITAPTPAASLLPDEPAPPATSTPVTALPSATVFVPPATIRPTEQPSRTSTPLPTRTSVPTVALTATTIAPSPSVPTVAAPTSTAQPTATSLPPINAPTSRPTASPTALPTATPSSTATTVIVSTPTPTNTPTSEPGTPTPTNTPTSEPGTPTPTDIPISEPTSTPTITPTELPSPTPTEVIEAALRPVLECVLELREDRYVAFFGYANSFDEPVELEVGSNNRFSPGPIDRGQPSIFPVGRSAPYPEAAFSVIFDGKPLVWFLDGRTATASLESKRCEL